MELQQFRYVVALSQERHFQRAAQRLNVTQPTLSQQIGKLEKELGVYLFERSPQNVKLTADGERFLPYAMTILATIDEAKHELQKTATRLEGRVAVGVIPTMGPYILPRIIARLRRNAPDIKLELHDLTTSALLENLRKGQIDIGILSLPITESGIAVRKIATEPFLLAVPSRHALAKHKRITVGDIDKENLLILQEGHCFRNQMMDFCKRSSNDARIIFQGASLTSVMRLAASGEGLTLVPQMAASGRENPGLTFIPFKDPVPTRDIAVAWRNTTPLTRSQEFFLDIVETTFQNSLRP